MVDAYHYTLIQTMDCTEPRGKPNVNHALWMTTMIMMDPCRWASCNIYHPVQDVSDRGGCAWEGTWGM